MKGRNGGEFQSVRACRENSPLEERDGALKYEWLQQLEVYC